MQSIAIDGNRLQSNKRRMAMTEERREEAGETEVREPLRLVRDAPNLSGAKSCPLCGRTVAKDAVLCVFCGYDFATGKRVVRARPKKSYAWLVALVVLLAAIVAAWWWFGHRPPMEQAREWTAQVEEVVAEKFEAVQQVVAEKKALAEQRREKMREELRRKFEAAEPMWVAGNNVVLRRRTGVVTRGKLVGVDGRDGVQFVVVEEEDGERVEVPMKALDAQSRRRIDAEFREKWVEGYLVRQLGAGAP